MPVKNASKLLILLALSILSITACNSATPAAPDEHSMAGDEMKHGSGGMAHEHAEVPNEFTDLTNPFNGNTEAMAAGQVIFETNCVVCHGPQGKGDGPGAAGLTPKPADLSDSQMMGGLTDGYLFWRVSEGGQMEPFNSAMPPWKASLSEEQRWQVISYVRSFTGSMSEHMEDEHPEEESK